MNIIIKLLFLFCFKQQEACDAKSKYITLNTVVAVTIISVNKFTKFKIKKHFVLYIIFTLLLKILLYKINKFLMYKMIDKACKTAEEIHYRKNEMCDDVVQEIIYISEEKEKVSSDMLKNLNVTQEEWDLISNIKHIKLKEIESGSEKYWPILRYVHRNSRYIIDQEKDQEYSDLIEKKKKERREKEIKKEMFSVASKILKKLSETDNIDYKNISTLLPGHLNSFFNYCNFSNDEFSNIDTMRTCIFMNIDIINNSINKLWPLLTINTYYYEYFKDNAVVKKNEYIFFLFEGGEHPISIEKKDEDFVKQFKKHQKIVAEKMEKLRPGIIETKENEE